MHVVIIGTGVVGASIAYELCQVPGLKITVIDKKPPAQASTGAALGVLMGVISHKIKGKAWRMRQTSISTYEDWIPQLEAASGRKIPYNRQGIVSLCLEGDDLAGWESLATTRHSQGWQLEIWNQAKLQQACPQLNIEKFIGAVYSPQDRQLDPTTLTLALVDAAMLNGVTFKFGVEVLRMTPLPNPLSVYGGEKLENFQTGNGEITQVESIETSDGKIAADLFIISAGLGSSPLTDFLNQKIDIRPVLGQAIHFHVGYPLGKPEFQPTLTGNDVHIVPCGAGVVPTTDYWVGATVEFPTEEGNPLPPDPQLLESVKQQAISYCPQLANATVSRTWSGLRPRPENRPAPIIEKLPGTSNILIATGHYRNGVLLAPATASTIREMIISNK